MLIYIHIPKCAGSTMMIYLRKYYRIHQVKTWWREDWESISPRAQCVFGHMPFSAISRRYPNDSKITFLRDPVERVISLYFHICRKYSHPEHKYFREHTLNQLMRGKNYAAFDNDMVRIIGGMDKIAFQPPAAAASDEDLERAKRNLLDFDAIGFVETFEQDLTSMAKLFGWDDIAYNKIIVGARPKREDLHPDTVKLIEENTLLDTELYNYAKGLDFYE